MPGILDAAGYSHEDEYFYKLNKELIEKRRKMLAVEKAAVESQQKKAAHWMRCPKCGEQMAEINMCGINVDKCSGCSGIYFDNGELETLLSAKEPGSFFTRLKKVLT